MESNTKPILATPCLYKCLVTGSSFLIFPMHYKTVFLAICTLFAAGTVSASALPHYGPSDYCNIYTGDPCDPSDIEQHCCNYEGYPGMVNFCVSVVFILMLLFHFQVYVFRVMNIIRTEFVVTTIKTSYLIVCSICFHIKLSDFH